VEQQLEVELKGELANRLRQVARAHGQAPQELALALLARGLHRAALRHQAAQALHALTPRQQEVARLIARGLTNQQIAEALVVSTETIKTHVSNVLDRFAAASKADLRVLLLDLGVRWWETDRTHLPLALSPPTPPPD
jgi:DNA-binding NarL/FixJ family response regulator